MLTGRATPDGTHRFARRFERILHPGHFRDGPDGLCWSSLGLGGYLGSADDDTDHAYVGTVCEALRRGVNVLDVAINYRHMRSERAFGRALEHMVSGGEIARDEVVVASKTGFIAFDGSLPPDPRGWFARHYLARGLTAPEDVVARCHAINPAFLDHQISLSVENLGIETIDVHLLHNPETQRAEVGPREFAARLRRAFETLERQVETGRIARYGLATWRGLLVPREALDHLSLAEALGIAREVAGGRHHLRVIQLPFNAGMTQALTVRNQGSPQRPLSLLEHAREAGLAVMTSASVGQGRPVPCPLGLPAPPRTCAQQALQFARSAPGVATALFGTTDPDHLRENVEVAGLAPIEPAAYGALTE